MLDALLRAAPHKARTEREQQQADEVYSGQTLRVCASHLVLRDHIELFLRFLNHEKPLRALILTRVLTSPDRAPTAMIIQPGTDVRSPFRTPLLIQRGPGTSITGCLRAMPIAAIGQYRCSLGNIRALHML
jgi:hypothetical protein